MFRGRQKKNELATAKRTKIRLIQVLTQLREYKKVESVCSVVGLEGKKRDVRKTICSCCAINRKTGLDFTYCAFIRGNVCTKVKLDKREDKPGGHT